MNKQEFFNALDGLMAYDKGCTDSGIHDEDLRAKVKQELQSRKSVKKDLLRFVIAKFDPDKGYSIECVQEFIDWLGNEMEFYMDF